MPRALTQAKIRDAVQKAAKKWIDDNAGQSAGARAARRRGTPISQQNLGWASRGEKIGEKMAHDVAALRLEWCWILRSFW